MYVDILNISFKTILFGTQIANICSSWFPFMKFETLIIAFLQVFRQI